MHWIVEGALNNKKELFQGDLPGVARPRFQINIFGRVAHRHVARLCALGLQDTLAQLGVNDFVSMVSHENHDVVPDLFAFVLGRTLRPARAPRGATGSSSHEHMPGRTQEQRT